MRVNSKNVDELPIRPIVSNIGTATEGISKHLTKILTPLSTSKYTIKSTKDFVAKIKHVEVPAGFKLIRSTSPIILQTYRLISR